VDRYRDRARGTVQGGARIVAQQHAAEDSMAAGTDNEQIRIGLLRLLV
jgi:hypothetical protein